MRRYGFRILAAILTFSLGVALSLVFGLFRVPGTGTFVHTHTELRGTSCPKRLRALVNSPAVDSQFSDPLKLEYIRRVDGREPVFQLRLENTTSQTITSYVISGQKNWDVNGKRGVEFEDWTTSAALAPGELRTRTLENSADGLSLRVDRVTFLDGSVWVNPREPK